MGAGDQSERRVLAKTPWRRPGGWDQGGQLKRGQGLEGPCMAPLLALMGSRSSGLGGWAGGLRVTLLAWKERAEWGLSEALVGSLATFGEAGIPAVGISRAFIGVGMQSVCFLKGP